MDHATLRERLAQTLAQTEEQIAGGELRIARQREIVVDLERRGLSADHAKYLLAGFELLQAAYRDRRTLLLQEQQKRLS